MPDDISFQAAQARMDAEARKVFEKELHPDGRSVEFMVFDPRQRRRSLPNVGVRLWANRTWEYTNGPDDDEEEEDPSNQQTEGE